MSFQPTTYAERKANYKPLKRGRLRPARKTARKKKSGRAKLPSRKKLVDTLDSLTSQIVRLRDGQCVLCHATEGLTCGHLFGRRSHGARWDIERDGNCHVQCFACNYRHNVDPWRYFSWFRDWHGEKAFNELYKRWSAGRKYSRLELIALVKEYEIKLEEMKASNDA